MMKQPVLWVIALCAILLAVPARETLAQAAERQPLMVGVTEKGRVSGDAPAVYTFEAESAGLLTVAIRTSDDSDLHLLVTDEDGQALQDGTSDRDLGGSMGAEQLAVTLSGPGRYVVQVQTRGSGAGAFVIGASWLPFAEMAAPPDPDGRPMGAQALEAGKAHPDSLNMPGGDFRDWYVLEASGDGMLVVMTKGTDGTEGDLILEAFAEGEYERPVERSDQDFDDDAMNESVTVPVTLGERLYVRVSLYPSQELIPYEVSAGLVPR
jgi:hypothetical protein